MFLYGTLFANHGITIPYHVSKSTFWSGSVRGAPVGVGICTYSIIISRRECHILVVCCNKVCKGTFLREHVRLTWFRDTRVNHACGDTKVRLVSISK